MTLIRWEPVRELGTIQHEMNRLFNTLVASPVAANGTSAGRMRHWIPATDLIETEDELVLRADLPGLSENDVNVELDGRVLTISGERAAEREQRKEGYYRVERASGSFGRSLTLPEGVDPEAVHASFDRGVLEVRIPKPEQRKRRKVEISLGGRDSEAKTIEAPTPTSIDRESSGAKAASVGVEAAS